MNDRNDSYILLLRGQEKRPEPFPELTVGQFVVGTPCWMGSKEECEGVARMYAKARFSVFGQKETFTEVEGLQFGWVVSMDFVLSSSRPSDRQFYLVFELFPMDSLWELENGKLI